MAKGRRAFSRLTEIERFRIEAYLRNGHSIREIARKLGRSPSTISYEVRKGTVDYMRSDLDMSSRYDSYSAQRVTNERKRSHARALKLADDGDTAEALRSLLRAGYSPYASLVIARRERRLKTAITVPTLYKYIHEGVLGVGEEVLVNGPYRKRRKVDFADRPKGAHWGDKVSIEERPRSILTREEFGHWEGDTVIGRRDTRACLFTMVERKTRFAIAMRVPSCTQHSIRRALDELEARYGEDFHRIFKTVTFDNGREFLRANDLKRSIHRDRRDENGLGGRFREVYYAHPFCSSERGSNEVMHRFLRRVWPKGTPFDDVEPAKVEEYMGFVNAYPRKIFGGQSAKDRLLAELANDP